MKVLLMEDGAEMLQENTLKILLESRNVLNGELWILGLQ